MKVYSVVTCTFTIYVGGGYESAERVLAEHVMEHPVCVTLTRTKFIYPGGMEDGVAIGLSLYTVPCPKGHKPFPQDNVQLETHAELLALHMIKELHQWSAMIVGPQMTKIITRKPEGSSEAEEVKA